MRLLGDRLALSLPLGRSLALLRSRLDAFLGVLPFARVGTVVILRFRSPLTLLVRALLLDRRHDGGLLDGGRRDGGLLGLLVGRGVLGLAALGRFGGRRGGGRFGRGRWNVLLVLVALAVLAVVVVVVVFLALGVSGGAVLGGQLRGGGVPVVERRLVSGRPLAIRDEVLLVGSLPELESC